jgi:DNA replication licensing factor MCM4
MVKRNFLNPGSLLQTPTVEARGGVFNRPDGKQTPTGENSTGGLAGQNQEENSTRVLWGTNISTDGLQQKIKNFVMHYQQMEMEDEDDSDYDFQALPYYVDKIKSLAAAGLSKLDINCDHIQQYDKDLYKQLEMYPTEVLQMMDMVCTLIAKENMR